MILANVMIIFLLNLAGGGAFDFLGNVTGTRFYVMK